MSWPGIISMGGYGFYIWTAYLLTLCALGGELLVLARRRGRCRTPNRGDRREDS